MEQSPRSSHIYTKDLENLIKQWLDVFIRISAEGRYSPMMPMWIGLLKESSNVAKEFKLSGYIQAQEAKAKDRIGYYENRLNVLELRSAVSEWKEMDPILQEIFTLQRLDRCNLFLTPAFDAEKCKEIKGDAVILTNENRAYFILQGQLVLQEDKKPHSVKEVNRQGIHFSEQDSLIKIGDPKDKEAVSKIIAEIILKGGPAELGEKYDLKRVALKVLGGWIAKISDTVEADKANRVYFPLLNPFLNKEKISYPFKKALADVLLKLKPNDEETIITQRDKGLVDDLRDEQKLNRLLSAPSELPENASDEDLDKLLSRIVALGRYAVLPNSMAKIIDRVVNNLLKGLKSSHTNVRQHTAGTLGAFMNTHRKEDIIKYLKEYIEKEKQLFAFQAALKPIGSEFLAVQESTRFNFERAVFSMVDFLVTYSYYELLFPHVSGKEKGKNVWFHFYNWNEQVIFRGNLDNTLKGNCDFMRHVVIYEHLPYYKSSIQERMKKILDSLSDNTIMALLSKDSQVVRVSTLLDVYFASPRPRLIYIKGVLQYLKEGAVSIYMQKGKEGNFLCAYDYNNRIAYSHLMEKDEEKEFKKVWWEETQKMKESLSLFEIHDEKQEEKISLTSTSPSAIAISDNSSVKSLGEAIRCKLKADLALNPEAQCIALAAISQLQHWVIMRIKIMEALKLGETVIRLDPSEVPLRRLLAVAREMIKTISRNEKNMNDYGIIKFMQSGASKEQLCQLVFDFVKKMIGEIDIIGAEKTLNAVRAVRTELNSPELIKLIIGTNFVHEKARKAAVQLLCDLIRDSVNINPALIGLEKSTSPDVRTCAVEDLGNYRGGIFKQFGEIITQVLDQRMQEASETEGRVDDVDDPLVQLVKDNKEIVSDLCELKKQDDVIVAALQAAEKKELEESVRKL